MTIRSPWAMTRGAAAAVCLLSAAAICTAGTVSYTGTFITPEDEFIGTLTVAAGGSVTLQTFGFGGGVNSASNTILPGGFDPLVALYQGTGPTALFLDGTADNLSNYSGEPPACPPAGLVTIGSVAGQCGDVRLNFNGLDAGTYTFLLTDANFVPNAIYETGGLLGDGFTDLTQGLPLTTCYDLSDCNNDTANWALDVTTSGSLGTSAPEPGSLFLVGLGLLAVLGIQRKNQKG